MPGKAARTSVRRTAGGRRRRGGRVYRDLAGRSPVPGGLLPVCPTNALLGIGCPGCGSLRMVYSLLRLDLPTAARFNMLGVPALLLPAVGVRGVGVRQGGGPADARLAAPAMVRTDRAGAHGDVVRAAQLAV